MAYYDYGGWPPYVSVAQRRANALRQISQLKKKGQLLDPITIEGRKIATTFWGKAWCDNLESYSDFANRLPRGRTYVRNGSVCDLQIEPGSVTALVCGSSLYKIKIGIKPLDGKVWSAIKAECAGQIGSLIELLQGKFSTSVMQIITRLDGGLFPKPAEIDLDCSCPDWADMCKHVAAALYGVGARLDQNPELLFVLRKVDHLQLISQAGDIKTLTRGKPGRKTIAADALGDVFGIELDNHAKPTDMPAPADLPVRGAISKANRPGQPRSGGRSSSNPPPRGRRQKAIRGKAASAR